MIECLIFDCDGTLVDSEWLNSCALEMMLREYQITQPAQSLLDRYKGWKLANVCLDLESQHSIRLKESFVADYRCLVAKLFIDQLKPVAGMEEALATIRLPMCVASSGPPQKIAQALELTGLRRFFGANIFSAYDVGSWKPDPGLFLHAARVMGFAPSACAVIEDSDVGIQAALNARMQPLWFTEAATAPAYPGVVRFDDMRALPDLLQTLRHVTTHTSADQ